MTKLLIAAAPAASAAGFVRFGILWPKEGKIVSQGDFTDAQWDILANEKMLRIRPAPTEAEVEEQDAGDLRTLLKAEIGKLEASDFEADGSPKAGALKERLPTQAKKITAKLVAEIWAELKPVT